jgi:hypothetical protein
MLDKIGLCVLGCKKIVSPCPNSHPCILQEGNKIRRSPKVMRTLIRRFLQKYWDCYPVSLPLVYMCEHNGVTGLVNARHYDDWVRQYRKERYQSEWMGVVPIAPSEVLRPSLPLHQVFLFTDKNVPEKNNRVGTLEQMKCLLAGFAVEYRDFQLPPIRVGDKVKYVNGAEETVKEENRKLEMVHMWLSARF